MNATVTDNPVYLNFLDETIVALKNDRVTQYDLLAAVVNTVPEDSAMSNKAKGYCKDFSNPAKTADAFLVTKFVALTSVRPKGLNEHTDFIVEQFMMNLGAGLSVKIARANSGIDHYVQH